MPWRHATLRGQRVLARVKHDGSFEDKGGRVEIRYKPSDARAYHASSKNLVVDHVAPILDDETCVPAVETPAHKKEPKKSAGAAPPMPRGPTWIAYTDGACTGNPGPAGSGWIVVAPGAKGPKEAYEFLGEATNNVAELTAIWRAVQVVPKDEPAVVHTDSQYAIGVLAKGWKAKANTELIGQIRAELRGRNVRFVYVKGHAGIPLNERADELAREAIRTGRSKSE
jgi:ribonuclease HI